MALDNATAVGGAERLRVLLATPDFPTLNVGFRTVIEAEPDMEVVGTVESWSTVREQVEATAPDVVVTEYLPFTGTDRTTGETFEAIRAARPGAHILAWASRASSEQFSLALKAGADGFLTREARPADLVSALRCVGRGQTYVSPSIVTRMVNTYLLKGPDGAFEDAYDQLTEREQEVLLLAAVGNTNREIAQTLNLSVQAIHNLRACLMEKLGFHDRVDLVKFAIRRGVINVADL